MSFHQYNTFKYNVSQYNADAFVLRTTLTESMTPADTRIDSPLKALTDAITASAAATQMVQTASKAEFVFLLDAVAKSIQNKGFSEAVRTNDWLQIKRISSPWGN